MFSDTIKSVVLKKFFWGRDPDNQFSLPSQLNRCVLFQIFKFSRQRARGIMSCDIEYLKEDKTIG